MTTDEAKRPTYELPINVAALAWIYIIEAIATAR